MLSSSWWIAYADLIDILHHIDHGKFNDYKQIVFRAAITGEGGCVALLSFLDLPDIAKLNKRRTNTATEV